MQKSSNKESPNEKSPKLKNWTKSGPISPLQVWGIENIAPDNVIRLGSVRLG